MRRDLLALVPWMLLAACPSPDPEAAARDAVARLSPSRPLEVTRLDDPCRIRVRTQGLLSLDDAAGTAGVASILTELADRNERDHGVRFGLDPRSGAIEADLWLPCEGGLAPATVDAAVAHFVETVETLTPHLQRALDNVEL